MNHIAEEIMARLEANESDVIHYGMPRRSGRYPWGSGEDPYQRTRDLLARVEILKKQGWKETPENIMKEFGLTSSQYRAQKALGGNLRRMDTVARIESLKEDGLSTSEIARKIGKNESTVRSLMDEGRKERMMQAMKTADFIREQIETRGMIDVGGSSNIELGVSNEKMKEALLILESEGYQIYGSRMNQVTNNAGQKTTLKVIGPKDMQAKDAYDLANIHSLTEYTSHDGGETFDKLVYPKSMDSKRLMVRYAEDGGIDKDGIIELRRGVQDLSLGESHYSQVRILVDNDRYLKGMALYSDDMPDGVDVIFNTNKTKDVPVRDVMKKIKEDPDNPFGSLIKPKGQSYYIDENGEKQLSLINKRADEGDWSDWKDAVPSQFLSKQSLSLAKKQLGEAMRDKQAEFDDICDLNQPTVKKHMLNKFADECDSAAVHLQAAALPGQKYRVIIPVSSLKDDEVYAPTYENGTKLALVRYPHGGTFEIPILTVNNKHKEAKKVLGPDITDAVAINKNVADRLSGADFDGDTVMCIPTHGGSGKTKISSSPPLKGLEGFDPKLEYGTTAKVGADGKEHYYRNGKEVRVMRNTQNEMGRVSNLITDMTLLGATDAEKAKAVRHSMVVIDAEKHKLDYKQSEIDNDIATLKKKYQNGGGASTLISKAKGETTVDKRQGSPVVNVPGATMLVKDKKTGKTTKVDVYDPDKPTGSLIYKTADDLEYTTAKVNKRSKEPANGTVRVSARGKRYVEFDDDNEWVPFDGKSDIEDGARVTASRKKNTRKQKSDNMSETDDAYTLISDADTPMERAYADYANSMKAMANKARTEAANTGKVAYSSAAKAKYQEEVASLNSKLDTALRNAPREREAQRRANAEVEAKKRANPDMKPDEIKKASQQAISRYRTEVGSVARRKREIEISDGEWEAIMAGAISENTLTKVLNNTNVDSLRARATPRTNTSLSPAKANRAKTMQASGYTTAEIAHKLGVSTSTVSKLLKGEN